MTISQLRASADKQLLRAVELLSLSGASTPARKES